MAGIERGLGKAACSQAYCSRGALPRPISNPSEKAAVVGVSGVGASHTTPMSQAIRRLALLPQQPAPFTQTFLHVVLR